MKMYTNSDQTAKLIELGFKPPMWRVARKFDDQPPRKIITSFGELRTASYEDVYAYSIGELIEMLMTIKGVKISFEAMYGERLTLIVKRLVGDKWDILYGNVGKESVDLLFDTIVKLKKEKIL